MKFSIILAVDEQGGFGKDGKIPWSFKKDFKHFQTVTKNAVCIMGRKTYEEIKSMAEARGPIKGGLLKGRTSYVISSTLKQSEVDHATVVSGLREVWDILESGDNKLEVFVIGGEKLFTQTLSWDPTIYMTVIEGDFKCDRFFPIEILNKGYRIISGTETTENNTKLRFLTYKKG